VRLNALIGGHRWETYVLLGAIMLLAPLSSMTGREVRTEQVNQQPASFKTLVIQGRITGIEGTLVTVKVPNGYPGGGGGHPQFVTAGPVFRVDVSHARVLLPDGKQVDKLPLAVGDRVLMVLTGTDAGSKEPGSVSPIYSASIVERVVQGDRIVTH
jgi:hypothetical protein